MGLKETLQKLDEPLVDAEQLAATEEARMLLQLAKFQSFKWGLAKHAS